ncbi:MAG: hypothetical protein F4Y79_05165 [Gemmatimonadetes bacterium]|nr:hypothetical protein [Gemmatimonadota bacterium]
MNLYRIASILKAANDIYDSGKKLYNAGNEIGPPIRDFVKDKVIPQARKVGVTAKKAWKENPVMMIATPVPCVTLHLLSKKWGSNLHDK